MRLVASNDYADLGHLQFVAQAAAGGRGGQKEATGGRGGDLVLKVPPGTVVYDISHLAAAGSAVGAGGEAPRGSGRSGDTRDFETDRGDAGPAASTSSSSSHSATHRPGYGAFSTLNRFKVDRASPLDWIESDADYFRRPHRPVPSRPKSELASESEKDLEARIAAEVEEELEQIRQERQEARERSTRLWDQYLGPVEPPSSTTEDEESDPAASGRGRQRGGKHGRRKAPRGSRDHPSESDEEEEGAEEKTIQDFLPPPEAEDGGAASIAEMIARMESSASPPPQMADLTREGQGVAVAMGGLGGKGNCDMAKNPSRPQPDFADAGTEGECRHLLLELKCIADIGLVGFPNAGKSTLLRCLTAATPRVASYPFTTLRPYLGALVYDDGRQVRVADLPGIIEGASEDRGLGLRFLRHIERTRALAYVVDASAGLRGGPAEADPRPWTQLHLLREELRAYDARLLQLPSIVVATKVDMLRRPRQTVAGLRKRIGDELGLPVFPVHHEGLGYGQLRAAFRMLASAQDHDDSPTS